MSLVTATGILDDVSRWARPLEELVPVNYGEFLCYPFWFELLKRAEALLSSTMIVLPLNGALLDNDITDMLCSISTLKVLNFSINAYFDETYENFMGLPKETISHIRGYIYRIRTKRPDILVRTSMVFDPEYQTDLERDLFIDYWKDMSVPAVIPAASCGRLGKKPVKPVKLPCRSIFSDFVIGFDGKLSSCCFDANMTLSLGYYSGNVKTDWKNSEMEELRRKHNAYTRETIPLCRACTFA